MHLVQPENFANVHFQITDLVAISLSAKPTEAVDILPNLGRGQLHPSAQLLRGNLRNACRFQLSQMPVISWQTPNDCV